MSGTFPPIPGPFGVNVSTSAGFPAPWDWTLFICVIVGILIGFLLALFIASPLFPEWGRSP